MQRILNEIQSRWSYCICCNIWECIWLYLCGLGVGYLSNAFIDNGYGSLAIIAQIQSISELQEIGIGKIKSEGMTVEKLLAAIQKLREGNDPNAKGLYDAPDHDKPGHGDNGGNGNGDGSTPGKAAEGMYTQYYDYEDEQAYNHYLNHRGNQRHIYYTDSYYDNYGDINDYLLIYGMGLLLAILCLCISTSIPLLCAVLIATFMAYKKKNDAHLDGISMV